MPPVLVRIPRRAAAVFVVLVEAAALCSAQTRSPSLFAAGAVREALNERGAGPAMTVVPRTAQEMRELVAVKLDSRLLRGLERISGSDFRYRLPGRDRTTHFGTIVMRYSSPAAARRMASLSSLRRGYFRNSKILIRYSVAALGRLLVVAYSENSGERRIVDAIAGLPARFAQAAAQAPIQWDEPDALTPAP